MRKHLLVLAIAAISLFSSCDKNDDNSTITTINVTNTVSSGSWRITYYWHNNQDQTFRFTGYSFTFAGGNVLTAVSGATTVTGTWQTGTDDSKVKLILGFITPGFTEISEDWEVFERNNTKIRLKHVSGGGGGTDYLTFEKN